MSSTAETVGRIAGRSRSAPSRIWFWVAGAIILLGVGFGMAWGVVSTVRAHDYAEGLSRTDTPGTLQAHIASGSSALIYFEGHGKPSPGALGLKVTAPDGSPVQVQPYDAVMEYEILGWVGRPVASFSTATPGTYSVTAEKAYNQGRISAGDNFVRTQAINIVGALVVIALSIVAGLVIVIVIGAKRSTATPTQTLSS